MVFSGDVMSPVKSGDDCFRFCVANKVELRSYRRSPETVRDGGSALCVLRDLFSVLQPHTLDPNVRQRRLLAQNCNAVSHRNFPRKNLYAGLSGGGLPKPPTGRTTRCMQTFSGAFMPAAERKSRVCSTARAAQLRLLTVVLW